MSVHFEGVLKKSPLGPDDLFYRIQKLQRITKDYRRSF